MSDAGEPDFDLFIENMVKVRDELKDKVSANIAKAQRDQKEYYNKRHSPEVRIIIRFVISSYNCLFSCRSYNLALMFWLKIPIKIKERVENWKTNIKDLTRFTRHWVKEFMSLSMPMARY